MITVFNHPYIADKLDTLLVHAKRFLPRRGRNCSVDYRPDGIVISVSQDVFWRHPWSILARFERPPGDPTAKPQWFGYAWPGFLNGHDPVVRRFNPDGSTSFVDLTDPSPAGLALSFRNPMLPGGISASDDGDIVYGAAEGYPSFFSSIGVKPAFEGGTSLDSPQIPGKTREIRACDVVLQTPRQSTASSITVGDPIGDSRIITIENRFVAASAEASRIELYSTSKFVPFVEPSLQDRLTGEAAEPNVDEIKIATVWLVSQPGAASLAEPDASWTPYVQYNVFWNLSRASRQLIPSTTNNDPITLNLPLALGTGQTLINSFLSPINDANSVIVSYFNATDYRGVFYSI